MSMTAAQVLKLYEWRLRKNTEGATKWHPSTRQAVEALVARLRELPPGDVIEIRAVEDEQATALFARVATGEVVGRFVTPPAEG